jgi:2-oxoisovalerate dehydrogenase E2 component (dihydrolipoyl transacylase)
MEFALPELGEGVYEAELVAWLVKAGDTVKRGQNLMEVLTDKATMEVPAPFAGTISALHAEPGQQLKVGDVVLSYTPAGAASEERGARSEERKEAVAGNGAKNDESITRTEEPAGAARSSLLAPLSSETAVRAAPSVRQFARKLGIDLSQVHGSGPGGRVLIDDLSSHVARQAAPAAAGKRAERPEPKPDYGKPGTRIKVQGLRRKIAEHMVLSKRTIPHYSYVDECDVTELVRVREALKPVYAGGGVRLTYLAFVVKAVVAALKEVPLINATFAEQAGEIVLHDRYHIGIAVATPSGLMVPVLRDADRKNLGAVAREIERLSADARVGKSKLDDLRGSTFTITSIGSIGGLISTPVINHPEVGIMAIGKVVKRPVYDTAGSLRPADMVYLSWSFDHRVVDGAVAAVFGNAVIRQLQNPLPLLVAAQPGERGA